MIDKPIGRRQLLTTLAGAGVALIPGMASSAPEPLFRFPSSSDAAIITSARLIEIDPGRPSLGELTRRLNHALRQRKVLDHIARTQSQLFALTSVTLNGPRDLILDLQTTLDWQSEFVSQNFGRLAINDLPVYIATSIGDDRDVLAPVLDTINYITWKSGFWPGAKITRAWDVFSMEGATRSPETIDLVTLWPFSQGSAS